VNLPLSELYDNPYEYGEVLNAGATILDIKTALLAAESALASV